MDTYDANMDDAARKIQEKLVRSLDEKRNAAVALSQASAALESATAAYREAWNAARSAGWAEQEMKRAGLAAPAPAKRAKKRKKSAPAEDVQNFES